MTSLPNDERARQDAAYAARGDVVEGSAQSIEGRRLAQIVSLRLDADTVAALRDIAERRRASLSDLLREGLALLMASEQRTMVVTSLTYTSVSSSSVNYYNRPDRYGTTGGRVEKVPQEVTGE